MLPDSDPLNVNSSRRMVSTAPSTSMVSTPEVGAWAVGVNVVVSHDDTNNREERTDTKALVMSDGRASD
jgi:hypothetical protein